MALASRTRALLLLTLVAPALSGLACAGKKAGADQSSPPPELAAVYYASGSKQVNFDDRPAVAQAATELERNPALHLLLIGRTDSHGDSNSNLQLGLQRAIEFRKALLARSKIDKARVHVGSRGQADPSANNETEAGRAINRRVEFFFFYPDGTPLKSRFAPPIIIEGEP